MKTIRIPALQNIDFKEAAAIAVFITKVMTLGVKIVVRRTGEVWYYIQVPEGLEIAELLTIAKVIGNQEVYQLLKRSNSVIINTEHKETNP